MTLVLASGSRFRQKMLADAGVAFNVARPEIDERAVEAPLKNSGATPQEVAEILAEAKALDVSARMPERLVLGCDQTLSLGDDIFHKPATMEEARRQLLKLSGQTHQLNSAAVLAQGGEVVWRFTGVARMTMRMLAPAFIGRYLAQAGAPALESVGAYQVEGLGVQLFARIEGDHFTIIGLPLLPVLDALRTQGVVDG